ncbi:unnamed protein product [Parnassius mnemosyne]|uniref:Histone-lysine N-methyltransferase SETMAR n=1 Tax=Parnassius mnemosyne TaxID=213953 RepID=A0AAV1KM64_9NEOP
MTEDLAAKQPILVNHSRPLLLDDNARPHTAQQTTTKLDELQLECLRYPPYSSDLSPTDYHFFRILDNSYKENNSTPMRQSKQPSKSLLILVTMVFLLNESINYL